MALIAVTGATGQLGRLVVAQLVARVGAARVKAVVRSPAKAADLGVEARGADYEQPELLTKAFEGVHTVVLISASEIGKRAQAHKNVIDAAKAAGVKHVVYTSLLRADHWGTNFLAKEHLDSEAALKASGLAWTILRNGWYLENFYGLIGGAVGGGGAIIGAAGEGKFASALRSDFAEAAAVVAADPDSHAGKTYELAGDAGHTLGDLAAEVAKQSGKPITYHNMTEAEYAKVLAGFGYPAFAADLFAWVDAAIPTGILYDDSKTLSKLIGHPTGTVAQAVTAFFAAGKAAGGAH